jgi:asparagine synthase (glutamine-hydrolysing)
VIGYFRWWQDRGVSADRARDFAAALATKHWPKTRSIHGEHSVSVHAAAAAAWAPAPLGDGRTILFTGDLFGRYSLARDFGLPPSEQAAIYAAARDRWGEDADLKLDGIYAAILFRDDRREVEIVRSPLRAPPVYIAKFPGGVVAASLPRAIHATGEVPKALDQHRLADALLTNHKEQTRSWFENVWALPNGTRVVINDEDHALQRYYYATDATPVRLSSDREYEEAAHELLLQSVAEATEGAKAPGVSLSGGYDSQAIAYALTQLSPGQRVVGLTHVPSSKWNGKAPDGRFGNEWRAVQAIAAMYPEIDPHEIKTDNSSLERHLTEFFDIGGLPPSVAFNMVWIHELYARAKQLGSDLILDGTPGNITLTFEGQAPYGYYLSKGRLITLVREVLTTLWRPGGSRKLLQQILSSATNDAGFATVVGAARRFGLVNSTNALGLSFINPNWEEESGARQRQRQRNVVRATGVVRSVAAQRVYQLETPNVDRDAIRQTLELLHGMPIRSPLSHRKLTEFCLGLPPDQFYRFGEDRRLARRMLRGKIPDSVLDNRLRGQQSADYHSQIIDARPELLESIDRFKLDADLDEAIDLDLLRGRLEALPKEQPMEYSRMLETNLIPVTINYARFLRHVAGRN